MDSRSIQYAYKYAILDTDPAYYGQCIEVQDTTVPIFDPMHVPVTDIDTVDFTFKWYYPIPAWQARYKKLCSILPEWQVRKFAD